MRIFFYSILKALFILKIFKFLSWRFGHLKKGFIRNVSLRKNLETQPQKQTIAMQILPNISRSKENKTMKFG